MANRFVWKESVYITSNGRQVNLPLRSKIVHVGVQQGSSLGIGVGLLAFWFEFEHEGPGLPSTEPRSFRVFGTGDPIPPGWEYRGSVQDGPFVWHLYEGV